MSMQDPNQASKEHIQLINKCIDKSKSLKKNQKNKQRKAWVTKEITELSAKKETLFNAWRKDVKNVAKKGEYDDFIKVFDKKVKAAKSSYDHQEIENNKSNPRRLWEIVNLKLGKNKKKKIQLNILLTISLN